MTKIRPNRPVFLSSRMRWWLFLTGVILPITGIVAAFFGFEPAVKMWQADAAWIYAALLLTWPPITVVLPLIVPCLLCMGAMCIRPATVANGFVRYGVYMGAVLALTYFVIAIVCAGWIGVIAGAIFGFGLAILLLTIQLVARYWRRFSLAQLITLTTVVCVVAATITYLDLQKSVLEYLAVTAVTSIIAAPALNALAYVLASVFLFRANQRPLSLLNHITLLLTTIVAWFVSWRAAIDLMLDEYSRLPTQADCYLCSAAANGHGWFVRRHPTPTSDGKLVNQQMRRCKFLEICLACAAPGLHRRLRNIYDAFGPSLARRCQSNVWFADATYVMFKPLEWTAQLLRSALSISSSKVRELY